MECNKDEAIRAKTIAEEKLENKDYAGAKKFALKAQSLYKDLDGISHLLTTVDIYICAENKIGGEVDWYGVLGVNPSADDAIIKKNYRKLALMLHPDKNKSVGADGAFKIISQAWSVLSDNTKRSAYNVKRGSSGFQQRFPMHSTNQHQTSSQPNGTCNPVNRSTSFFNFASKTTSIPKPQNNFPKARKAPKPTPAHEKPETFWTICHRCKMHYEFVKAYLNSTLLCPHCKKAFSAKETAPPFETGDSPGHLPHQHKQTPLEHGSMPNSHDPGMNVPAAQKSVPGRAAGSARDARYEKINVPGVTSLESSDPSIATKAANVVLEAQNKLKRAYAESHASASVTWEEYLKKRRTEDQSTSFKMNYNTNQANGGSGTASAPGSRIYGYRQQKSFRDLTPNDLRNMQVAKARMDIQSKLNQWMSEETSKTAGKETGPTKGSKKQKISSTMDTERHDSNEKSDLPTEKSIQDENGPSSDPADNVNTGDLEAASMTVPDPDFHDFDNDRAEDSFGDNEVWAAYDDDDGMPRFYALISKVISRKPFKLRISWLNSKSNSEFSTLDWVAKGFYKTCGEFRVSKYEICTNINSFSQKANWSKGSRGAFLIFPQKDDVWAIYKNWSSDWNEHTPDDVIHKYDMVIVLDEYTEEQGISVAPLVKVVGFKTVFRPNLDPQVVMKIPKEEMFRFSHRVPCHVLTGQEAETAPKGCLELDPAATPLELLQVIAEADEANGNGKVLQDVPSSSADENVDETVVPSSSADEDADETAVPSSSADKDADETAVPSSSADEAFVPSSSADEDADETE